MKRIAAHCLGALVLGSMMAPLALAQAAGREVYRCPGNPILYTDALSAKEAHNKGCRTLEGAPITVVQGTRPRLSNNPASSVLSGKPGETRPSEQRVDPNEQRTRDSDARRILEGELKREQERLAQMQKDYNNGEPERQGDERNYQKYLDRVADMKASIARKEGDIAAIKRELSKLPQ
jgi:hypothetical protein